MQLIANKCVFKKPSENCMSEMPILRAFIKSVLTVQLTPVL